MENYPEGAIAPTISKRFRHSKQTSLLRVIRDLPWITHAWLGCLVKNRSFFASMTPFSPPLMSCVLHHTLTNRSTQIMKLSFDSLELDHRTTHQFIKIVSAFW